MSRQAVQWRMKHAKKVSTMMSESFFLQREKWSISFENAFRNSELKKKCPRMCRKVFFSRFSEERGLWGQKPWTPERMFDNVSASFVKQVQHRMKHFLWECFQKTLKQKTVLQCVGNFFQQVQQRKKHFLNSQKMQFGVNHANDIHSETFQNTLKWLCCDVKSSESLVPA